MKTQGRVTNAGFVPVELLAIICVLLLAAGVLLPSISRVKSKSASLICMNNHRQIVQAWQLYAQDSSGKTANNYTIQELLNSNTTKRYDSWANNVISWSVTSDIPTPDLATQYRVFRPYAGDDYAIYRCPADNFVSAAQQQRGFRSRTRSVSMNALIGRPESNPTTATGRSWIGGGQYRQWLKVRDIHNPAKTWVTIDEHPDSINDGMFINEPTTPSWTDIPGTLHARSTSFSFADGHVESRKWRSKRWMVPVKTVYTAPAPFDPAGRQDFAWYIANSGFVRF